MRYSNLSNNMMISKLAVNNNYNSIRKKKICGFPVSWPYLAFGRQNPDPKRPCDAHDPHNSALIGAGRAPPPPPPLPDHAGSIPEYQ
jgi:hypothetical protein